MVLYRGELGIAFLGGTRFWCLPQKTLFSPLFRPLKGPAEHIRAPLGIGFREIIPFSFREISPYMTCLLSLFWGMSERNQSPSFLYHPNWKRFDWGSVFKVFLTTTNVLISKKIVIQRCSWATTLLIQNYQRKMYETVKAKGHLWMWTGQRWVQVSESTWIFQVLVDSVEI